MVSVSVIIPNYNHAKYLKERIDSVINQTFVDFEVIILDDCSTDESRSIIEEYRHHPKVQQIVFNTTNTGSTFLQWKKGIELAKGEWIWIAESDDWCEVTLLNELFYGVTKYPTCVVSYCQSIMLTNNDILWRSESKNLETYMEGKDFVTKHMLVGNSIFNASMCIFKKEVYYQISDEFTKYKFSGDWLFWIEASLQGDVYISGKTLNYFRKHPQDVSSIAFTKGLIYTEYFRLLAYFEKLGLLTNNKKQLLIKKLKQFLLDKRINEPAHQEVAALFKNHLGTRYYIRLISFYAKSSLKYIKNLKFIK